jgi:PRTRC genetic system protein A
MNPRGGMESMTDKLFQETLFSFLGEEEPEAIQDTGKGKKTTASTKSRVASKDQKKTAVSVTKSEPETWELNTETIIRYGGENIPLTDYFTPEEITNGLPESSPTDEQTTGDNTAEKLRNITGEDVRKRLENDFGELTEELTTMTFIKEKNMIIPVLTARKKGSGMILDRRHGVYLTLEDAVANRRSNMYLPGSDGHMYHIRETEALTICKKARKVPSVPALVEGVRLKFPRIPWGILTQFLVVARHFARTYGAEIHGEIYWGEEGYRLVIPSQIVSSDMCEPTEQVAYVENVVKVMEIHSHHTMEAYFSSQDDRSEQAPILYAVVGRVLDFFPQILVRTCLDGEYLFINPHIVFESPLESPTSLDFPQVSVKGAGDNDTV